MKIVYSSKCAEYARGGHPESPDRVTRTHDYLQSRDFSFVEPDPATRDDVLTVHSEELVSRIESQEIYEYALLSAGGALKALQLAREGETAFSLMRPPGHHAETNSYGGFCYFNNIAIAVHEALSDVGRVGIVDIDAHHGNGTEEIFLGREEVLYVSLHEGGIYPASGGESRDNARNYPLRSGADPKEYLETLDEALDEVRSFDPEMIAVSAGFDSYQDDPLTRLSLDVDTYEEIGGRIRAFGLPVFAVLEGGYADKLPECIHRFLLGLDEDAGSE